MTDLDACPVWQFVPNSELLDGQDEETLRPRPDWRDADPDRGLAIARATFTAADGAGYRGFYYVTASDGMGLTQPTVVTNGGMVNFWLGMFPPAADVLDGYLAQLGTTRDSLFPLAWVADVPVIRHAGRGVLPGFRKWVGTDDHDGVAHLPSTRPPPEGRGQR